MSVLDVAITVFIILETLNVIILYFKPDFKYGNGVSVFKEWDRSKENEDRHLFNSYMVNWVAGSKLVFIALLIAILFVASEAMKVYAVIAAIISIASYFVKLHPIIKKMDKKDLLTRKGYSKILALMIIGFLSMFTFSLMLYFVIK